MSVFFKIAGVDLTGQEDIQSHEIKRDDVYQSWVDGNWIEHREVARTKISGEITLGFFTAAEFADFTALCASARDPAGWYPVTVYVSNTGETVSTQAFLDMETESKWDRVNNRQWHVTTIKLTER